MDDQAFCISYVGKVRKQFHGIDEFFPCIESAFYSETDQRSITPVEIFLCNRMVRLVLEARVIHPVYQRVAPEKLRDLQRILGMPLLPQDQRLESLEEKKGIKWAQSRSNVAEPLHSGLYYERHIAQAGEIPEDVPEFKAVIAGVRFSEFGKLTVPPVEFPAVHDQAADRGPMAADKFCRGKDADVRSEIERPHEAYSNRVIDNERYPCIMSNICNCLEVGHVQFGIADSFGIDCAGSIRQGSFDFVGVCGINEFYFSPQLGESVVKELVSSSVEIVSRDNFISGLSNM